MSHGFKGFKRNKYDTLPIKEKVETKVIREENKDEIKKDEGEKEDTSK